MTRAVQSLTIVESDTGHPLLRPARPAGRRGSRRGDAGIDEGRVGAGSAQARTAGQARAGTGDSRDLPARQAGAVDAVEPGAHRGAGSQGPGPANPSSKPRQTLYGLRAVARAAALDRTPGRHALPARQGPGRWGSFNMVGTTLIRRMHMPQWDRLESPHSPHRRRIAPTPPAGLHGEELQGHPAPVRRARRRPSHAGRGHAADAGRARRQLCRWCRRCWPRAPTRTAARRIRAHGLAACGEPGDGGVGLRRDGPAGAVRRVGAGGTGRADRRAARAHRTPPG